MQLKTGVDIRKVTVEMVLGLVIADGVFRKHDIDMVVTSVCDGKHMSGSKHYLGMGADIRIWGLEGKLDMIISDLKKAMNNNFDVVKESDHIHLEYDPHS
jgi:hypothetical protein